jgi:hypothetical protein
MRGSGVRIPLAAPLSPSQTFAAIRKRLKNQDKSTVMCSRTYKNVRFRALAASGIAGIFEGIDKIPA